MDVARVLDAPPDTVWALVAGTAHWPEWGPSVTGVSCPDATVRTGTRGRIRTVVGLWLPFTVTEVDPGRRWSWRIGPVPATGHRLEDLGDGRTRVVFEVPRWAAPYALVCRVALRRLAARAGQPRGTSRSS